ncbi:MAG: hypothetical protein A2Z68_00760 [Candidatus Nealsonbacteria bacterium RBG_13_38_11]|uniref:Uncharacterized protein n=1 Tax=Candidatus Nealsonbacteria bacterium RBG_13_38_11 TaxID=1801662 RepID=A0A1G2E164_9BACT|nr:MAG: hypothetical protein A2Z68_00760 [Candidatus Nealsonbacteria bacterium RBG_13_38_11]
MPVLGIIAICITVLALLSVAILVVRSKETEQQPTSPQQNTPPPQQEPISPIAEAYAAKIRGLNVIAHIYAAKLEAAVVEESVLQIKREADRIAAANAAEWRRQPPTSTP